MEYCTDDDMDICDHASEALSVLKYYFGTDKEKKGTLDKNLKSSIEK